MTPTKIRSSPPSSAQNHSEPVSPTKESLRPTNGKPKRPPPITPRRFTKFFTPRAIPKGGNRVRTSRRALQDITRPALNRKGSTTEQPLFGDMLPTIGGTEEDESVNTKKRKLSFSSMAYSPRSSPVRKVVFTPTSSQEQYASPARNSYMDTFSDEEEEEDDNEDTDDLWKGQLPIRQHRRVTRGNASLLSARLASGKYRFTARKAADWRDETSNFYSGPEDNFKSYGVHGPYHSLPFSAASCNTNSLVAVGDEEGGVSLFDSSKKDQVGFTKPYLLLKPHGNAVMDVTFSSDDQLLATAAGDQTARIIDMSTQQEIYRLKGHASTLKQVHFQPSSNDKVLATSSRDGSIKLWDLRCSRADQSVLQIQPSVSMDGLSTTSEYTRTTLSAVNSIRNAHVHRNVVPTKDGPICKRARVRRDDISVTSIAFLRNGREHLLVSGSEADCCIKLWDMRTAYSSRAVTPLPVSTTQTPASHDLHREYGISAMAINHDCSRVYAACRDSTVYAYSTSHLVLGHAPEAVPYSNSSSRRFNGSNRSGLGPLYGFRHQNLKIQSFYVGMSIRKPMDGSTELLALGSSENCAVIFPTSESYLESLPKTCSYPGVNPEVDIPIYNFGAALVGGHSKEVSDLTWTSEGSLTTVGDDFNIRCWREDAKEAKELRLSGGRGGRRWMTGWVDSADVGDLDDDE